ncbi:MAG: beta-ketoacyl-[acyl-carrier-protein] synthase II, partial [Bacteroidaceae bacterium]|nr:beta-ketoacyl-[acyl-carrier-protein] synthase II [Bacteroidaceae bacterium]
METKRVVITGMGVITSIGKNITEFKESLENGRLGISEIEGLDK